MATTSNIGDLWGSSTPARMSTDIGHLWEGQQTTAPTDQPEIGNLWSASTQEHPAPPTSSVGDLWGGLNPENGLPKQPAQPSSVGERFSRAWNNPNRGFLGRVFDTANTPLLDLHREGATGFEAGAEDVLSGLTSPLSLLLTIGTLGTGGLVESGGVAALRTAGLGAEEIGGIAKGAKILSDANKAGRSLSEGLDLAEQAGVNRDLLQRGLSALKDAGFTTDSLTSKGMIRRGGAAGLRVLSVSPLKAETVATGLQALTDAGFTAQQAMQAAELSPKVLDALKDGDYKEAERLAVNVLGSGTFAALGAHSVAKDAAPIFDEVSSRAGLRVKDTPENNLIAKHFGKYDRDVVQAGRSNELWAQDLRDKYGKITPTQQQRIFNYVQAGLDPDTMASRHNALAEAAGSSEHIPSLSSEPVTSGMSSERVQELIDSKHIQKSYTPAEISDLLTSYDPRQLSAEEKALAVAVREKLNESLETSQKAGVLKDGIESYLTQIWEKDGNNAAANKLRHDAQQGAFDVNTTMARQRMFDNAFEGQLLGRKLAETDPIALAANNANSFARAIAAREAIARLKDSSELASDTRPLVALSGHGEVVDGENGASVLVHPSSMTKITIPDDTVSTLQNSGALQRGLHDGSIVKLNKPVTMDSIGGEIDRLENRSIGRPIKFDVEGNVELRKQIDTLKAIRDGREPASSLDAYNAQQKPLYAWDTHGYQPVDHAAFRGWKHVATSPSGDPVLLQSDMLVHPEAAEYLNRRLGLDSQGPGDNAVGKALLKANREGKGLLLFGSPFHVAQEALRAVMTGVNPFGIERWDLANDPVLAKGVEHGLTLGRDHRELSAFKDGELQGHSALLSKVPGLRQIQSGLDNFLFQKYIPSLKARAFRSLQERYAKAYPDWTADKVAEVAAADTNERFGGINYKKIGRTAATQNWFKLAALAPDWLEGEVRSIARPFGTEGKIARIDMLRGAAALWTASRVLNYLISGNGHYEAPFGVALKGDDGREKVYSIRTLPTDALHAISDPTGFISGRFSPIVRAGTEMATGRDEYGRKLQKSGLLYDLFRSVAPIPAQSAVKSLTGEAPELNTKEQTAKALGLSVYPYRTEAQKLADTLASDHYEGGVVDPMNLRAHRAQLRIEESVRLGEIPMSEVPMLAREAGLGKDQINQIRKHVIETKNLNPDEASLYLRAARLPMKDFLQVMDTATSREQKVLEPLYENKRRDYLTRTRKNHLPSQRITDAVYNRLATK
ncbi:MAG: hypothetical protein JSS87_15190 [Acidobacteria bacterium]|nr:hypothetical protein [Acidobacteriota bacterium]